MTETVTLHAKKNYDNPIGSDGRGMTIAAFHIAQDNDHLTNAAMRRDILTFLMSSSAVNYWKNNKKWLEACGKHANGKNLLRLTPTGLSVCAASINGQADTNTTQAIIDRWKERMCTGDHIASEPKAFDLPL